MKIHFNTKSIKESKQHKIIQNTFLTTENEEKRQEKYEIQFCNYF
jgi:hypothetical protein